MCIRDSTYHDAPQYQNEDEELDAIFQRTYGPIKRRLADDYYRQHQPQETSMSVKMKPECLLVDGYNVIHSWAELKDLASTNLGVARDRLIDIPVSYTHLPVDEITKKMCFFVFCVCNQCLFFAKS